MTARTAAATPLDFSLKKGLKWSGIGHGILFLIIIIKSLVFPSKMQPYIPSLRVDLVGLPDQLKTDLERLKTLPAAKGGAASEEKSAQTETETEDDDLVLNPTKRVIKKKIPKAIEKKIEARQKKALDRIKALNRISEAVEDDAAESDVVKGNIVSKGAALSGDAKESPNEQYYDTVLGRLQDNWSLPVWLSRQNLSAQVQVFIDSHGAVRSLKLVKSSGNTQFDEAVRRAVAASAPFPSPPIELRDSLLGHGILFGFPL